MDLESAEKVYCVYRIYCKDSDIKESYYGSTCNYYQRWHAHKHSTKNYKNPKHGYLVYQKIRDTGGFDNWDFEIIKDDMNKEDARNLEKECVLGNEFSLNSVVPARTNKEWRVANPDKVRAQTKRTYKKNPGYWAAYYQKRKDEYLEKVTCECGVTTSKIHILKHCRTQKHLDYLANQQN